MSRLLSNLPRLVLANAARPSSWAAVSPRPSSASLSTALLSRAQPPLQRLAQQHSLVAPPASPVQPAGQTRAFKMPRSMRKVSSPVARNTGKGKTARKHSARSVSRVAHTLETNLGEPLLTVACYPSGQAEKDASRQDQLDPVFAPRVLLQHHCILCKSTLEQSLPRDRRAERERESVVHLRHWKSGTRSRVRLLPRAWDGPLTETLSRWMSCCSN